MSATVIHSTASVHPEAQIGEGCEIGPYCVIGPHVVLGPGCRLHSHVVIDGHTTLGRDNEIFPFACLGKRSQDQKWRGGITRLEIGDGNIIRECVTINTATRENDTTRVGSYNVILNCCHIAHDCVVGNHVIMSGYAGLAGHVVVEDYVVLGGYVAVHQFCRLGKMCMVGGCSKVCQDIPPFMLADGNPAETLTINKVGLERNGVSEEAQAALRQAYKLLFREGLTLAKALERIETELPPLPELKHLVQFVRASERGLAK